MKRFVIVALVTLSGCATSQEVWGGRTQTREVQGVQAAAVRYFADNYDPADYLGEPQALCLVLGRPEWSLDRDALQRSARTDEMNPTPAFLSSLKNVRPRVVPIADCVWGEDLSEILKDSGERAIALGVSHPRWVTPNLARFTVSLRENPRKRFGFQCSASREPEGWRVRQCI